MAASATPRPDSRPEPPPVIAVAFSGGLDSTALLHAATRADPGVRVVALHVHHGLQPEADEWLLHCQRTAREFGAGFASRRLSGEVPHGDSVEAWARAGRHAALQAMAREAGADLLLLAHHRRDQAETFLLQAMRGAGLAGLACMPQRQWRDGLCWARPWLQQPRELILAYAQAHGLSWIDDPSNAQPRFLRNRLRLHFMQHFGADFPAAEAGLARAVRWVQQARDLAQELAETDLASLATPLRLDLAALAILSPARASNALRSWMARRQGHAASAELVERLLCEWRPGATLSWPARGGQWHAYRDGLFWAAHAPAGPAAHDADQRLDLSLPGLYSQPVWGGGWRVRPVVPGQGPGIAPERLSRLQQRARRGGEQFQRARGSVPRSLKKACQEAGLAPWLRGGPLLFDGDQLVAVAGLGVDARAFAPAGEGGLLLEWQDDSALPQSEGGPGVAA